MNKSLLADATDIVCWADRRDAEAELPRLLRKLALATTSNMKEIECRAGEGVRFGGWDGIISVENGNAYVPDGLSVWELGTSKDRKGKADDDYDKRTRDPLGIDATNATFVFVTARRWEGKKKWASSRVREGNWKGVRAYDADDLETWLETAPAVHRWISRHLGKPSDGAIDANSFWLDWSEDTQPNTSPELVLAGRQTAVQAIHGWLVAPSTPLVIRAESRPEALAVFAAAIQTLPDQAKCELLSRVVIVRESAAWAVLSGSAAPNAKLILAQNFDSTTAIASALRHGHAPVIILGRADAESPGAIEVPRISREEAANALHLMGFDEPESGKLATLARRSLITLRRKMSIVPGIEQPSWARPENGRTLLAALFAGRWSGSSAGDKKAISLLAGTSYEKFHASMIRWSNENDPPVRCVGDVWFLTSEEDAWSLLARYITSDDLDQLQQVVADVLGTPNPAFNLAEDRRWMAEVLGHKSPHSNLLKTGLANTLAIMGSRADTLKTTDDTNLSHYANVCVRSLLDTPDWKIWASLPLSLLAEAAPDEFLGAVDRELAKAEPTLRELYRDKEQDIFGSSPHTKLLWALETLAWSEDHLVRASLSLAKLAQIDPGGKLGNRPLASLRSIFLPWIPGTRASLGLRMSALDTLRQHTSDIAWKLMKTLLPRYPDHQTPTALPCWREWVPEKAAQVTPMEHAKATQLLVDRTLEDAGTDGTRWGDLIEKLPQLPRREYDAIVTKLSSLNQEPISPADSATVWNALRTLIAQHRSRPDAAWSLPSEDIDRLADVLPRFEPREPLHRFAWLFASRVLLPEGENDGWEECERAVASRQCDAVQLLYEQADLNWLSNFVEALERPYVLGAAIARSTIADQVEDSLLREFVRPDDDQCRNFVAGFVQQKVSLAGMEWARRMLSTLGPNWSPEQHAAFCVGLPFTSLTWDVIEELSSATAEAYWKSVLPPYVDTSDLERAARRLLEQNRVRVVADIIQPHIHRPGLSAALVVDTLELLARSSLNEQDQRYLSAHDIIDLLVFVSDASEIEEKRLVALEWAFLHALGSHQYTPKRLHGELARSPEFFGQVVSLAYRAESEESRELSADEQARSTHAYELLRAWRWRPLPGMYDGDGIDPEAMRDWVFATREILRASDRLGIGDLIIGQVLSGVPGGDDGAWPGVAIRDLIEELGSDDFEKGIAIGLLNSGGVSCRGPKEGGERERKDADKYERWARLVGKKWGRTASMLRRIRDQYEERARYEDQQAELREDLSQ